MGLNLGKCNVVCFRTGRNICDGSYTCVGSELETVSSYKYLEVGFASDHDGKSTLKESRRKE